MSSLLRLIRPVRHDINSDAHLFNDDGNGYMGATSIAMELKNTIGRMAAKKESLNQKQVQLLNNLRLKQKIALELAKIAYETTWGTFTSLVSMADTAISRMERRFNI